MWYGHIRDLSPTAESCMGGRTPNVTLLHWTKQPWWCKAVMFVVGVVVCGCLWLLWLLLVWTLLWTTGHQTTRRRTALRRTPFRQTTQIFALFFASPAHRFVLFLSLSFWVSSFFWWCFEFWDPQMCTFGLSGVGGEGRGRDEGEEDIRGRRTVEKGEQQGKLGK